MAYAEILYRVEDKVAIVTLNRPDRLNAWTPVMHTEVTVNGELIYSKQGTRRCCG